MPKNARFRPQCGANLELERRRGAKSDDTQSVLEWQAKVRRFEGIGQQIDEGASKVRKASQIYGYGHGLKGWFGEDVAPR